MFSLLSTGMCFGACDQDSALDDHVQCV